MTDDELKDTLTNDFTDDDILELLSFIPAYDPAELHPLGDIDFVNLELSGILSDEELSAIRKVGIGESGELIHKELSESFKELSEVQILLEQPESRTRDVTWKKLDDALQRYARTMQRYGKDVYHYGSDLALKAVHPTAYYNKGWTLESLGKDEWDELLSSVEDLKVGIYNASTGNMSGELDRSEAAGIRLERILRGNEVSPLPRYYDDALRRSDEPRESDERASLVPSPFAETGSTSTLKQMFPFFHYWSKKAEEFVNSEKEVNITMNVAKFFEDLNVTMHDKSDTEELESMIVKVLNRALMIAQSLAD